MNDADTTSRLPRRPLGRTGLQVTPLGLAAGAVRGVAPKGPKLTADDVERAYYEHGVNTFFVIRSFKEVAEGVRRLVRAGHRDDLVIMSMAGLPFGWAVRGAWAKQAKALGLDHIDVWLLGWVQGRWYVGGRTWRAMEALKAEGKVGAIGFSCHKRRLATSLARDLSPDVLMIRYNAAHRGAQQDIFEPLGDQRPGIVSYTATRWGMLLQPQPDAGFESGMTAAECYRFVLSNPSVDVALCAARSADEVRDDVLGVLEGPLAPARRAECERFGDAVHANARGGRRWMFR